MLESDDAWDHMESESLALVTDRNLRRLVDFNRFPLLIGLGGFLSMRVLSSSGRPAW